MADPFRIVGTALEGKYRIDKVVGEGGFGVVYRGYHLSFEQPIAIKCLKVPPHFTPEARELFLTKFREEGKHLARLGEHPSITRVYDFGIVDGETPIPYLVLEWLDGDDLEQLLARRRAKGEAFSESEALQLLRPAIDALSLAHGLGIAHRDIKPPNLYWAKGARGRVIKVLDFGIAKAMAEGDTATQVATKTSSGFSAFSPSYGAPEQFRSKKYGATGPWTDVHAIGLLLAEMVAGRAPFEGDEMIEFYEQCAKETRPTPRALGAEVSDEFEQVCLKALALSPKDRYATAGELLAAVDRLLQGAPPLVVDDARPAEKTATATVAASEPNAIEAPLEVASAAEVVRRPRKSAATVAAEPLASPRESSGTAFAEPIAFAAAPKAASRRPLIVGGIAAAVAASAILVYAVAGSDDPQTEIGAPVSSASAPTTGSIAPVKLELYVTSPAELDLAGTFKPIADKFGGSLDLRLEFVDDKPQAGRTGVPAPADEVGAELVVSACARKHSPGWLEVLICQYGKTAAGPWQACAQSAGIATAEIDACVGGDEGKQLVAASRERATKLDIRSRKIRIDDKAHDGPIREKPLTRAICGAFDGARPDVCSQVADSPKVNVVLLADRRCSECPTVAEPSIRSVIDNPVITKLDYGDPDGRALYDKLVPSVAGWGTTDVKLPTVVLDATLDQDPDTATALKAGLIPAGEGRTLTPVGEWNPRCADAGGCEREACKSEMVCRPELPNRLDLYFMSQCPYGIKGLDAMKEVLDNFKTHGATIDFAIHFIGAGDESALRSMHGQAEVDEDLREICAFAHYPKDALFLDYIWCRNKNIRDPNWQVCTGKATGIDTAVIQKCAEGEEGRRLLAKSFIDSSTARISGSPTWLVNHKFKFSGIDAETIKTNVCARNKLPGCASTLGGPRR